MEERMPNRLTDLFWSLPATRVIETQVGEQGVYFRAGERFGDICWPMVFQDRQLVFYRASVRLWWQTGIR